MPVSDILDTAGPMAKSATDIANSLDIMADRSDGSRYPTKGLISKVTGSWDNLKLGAVKTSEWRIEEILAEPDEDWFGQQVSLTHCMLFLVPSLLRNLSPGKRYRYCV